MIDRLEPPIQLHDRCPFTPVIRAVGPGITRPADVLGSERLELAGGAERGRSFGGPDWPHLRALQFSKASRMTRELGGSSRHAGLLGSRMESSACRDRVAVHLGKCGTETRGGLTCLGTLSRVREEAHMHPVELVTRGVTSALELDAAL